MKKIFIITGLILATRNKKLGLVTVLLTIVSLTYCGQTPKQITSADIKGIWHLNEWTSYRTLIFNDHTVFVDNHVDTVFTLNYSLSHDTLITWSG